MSGTYDSMAADSIMSMWPFLGPVVAFTTVTAAALALRAGFMSRARHWAGAPVQGSQVLRGVRGPSALWCVVLGLAVAVAIADLPDRYAVTLRTVLEALVILSITVTLAGVLAAFVAAASERRGLGLGVTGFAQTSVRLVVYIVGDLALDFSVLVWIRRFPDQFAIQHELRKRFLRRLQGEGIALAPRPLPPAIA